MDKADANKDQGAPQKINWLSIFGIVALVLLVAVVIYMVVIARTVEKNPVVQQFLAAWPMIQEMETLTQSQIEDRAAAMSADALLKNGEAYTGSGQYVVVDGSVNKEESMLVSQQLARDVFTDDVLIDGANYDFKGFILDDGLVLVDITGEAPDILDEGVAIRGYGKAFVLNLDDVFDLPWVGDDLRASYSNLKDADKRIVFLFSKGIKVLSEPAEMETPEMPGMDSTEPGDEPADETVEGTEDTPAEEPADEPEAEPVEEPEAEPVEEPAGH